jgi:NAD(P)-dependent dehydrogenase (short-subunit alcohol dehydrogenase family)
VPIELDLSGRVAFVTGGSRGLGRADALTLARAGADVVVADLLVESQLSEETDRYGSLATVARQQGLVHTEETVGEIESMGRRALAVRCDVTDRAEVDAAIARAVGELGSVDILVNNAGTLDHVAQFHEQSPELWERDLRVNLTGAFNCAQAAWPHMKERGWGRIVNMASDEDARDGGGPARDHVQCDRARRHRHGGVPHGECGHERADRAANRAAAPGRPAGDRERRRLPLLRSRLVRDRDRAERQRGRRALRLLSAGAR